MAYWRMQLHPAEPGESVRHAWRVSHNGFIGLDFAADSGDLTRTTGASLPTGQKDYVALAQMGVGDHVLIIAHHFPLALAKVAGDYK